MSLGRLTSLDWVFLVVTLASTGFAITKGLVRELISFAALIGGFILAVLYYPALGGRLVAWTRTDTIANLLAFVAIFIGTLLLGALISFIVNRFVKMASLEWIDRLLGGLFGFLRGWAACSVIVLGMVAFPVRDNEVLARSLLAPFVLAGARAAVYAVPQELKNRFEEGYKKVISNLNQSKSQ
jgi:membrane protein required for colicin V production